MIPATAAAVASPAPAPSAAPADTVASADFMALLLLLMGVGTGTPQPEGQAAGERPNDDAEGATTPSVPELAGIPAATMVPTPTAAITTPTLLVAAEIAMAPSPRQAEVASGVTPAPAPLPRTDVGIRAPAASSPRPGTTPQIDAAPVAVEAPTPNPPTPAEPGTQPAGVATAVHSAHEARDGARVRSAEDALRELGLVEEESAPPAMAAAPTPTATGTPVMAAAGRGAGVTDHHAHDAAERGERPSDGPGDVPVTTGPAPVLHGAASATALRESHRAEAPAAPGPVVEPHVVAEQIVQAARIVGSGDEAEMHVQLDPPALGGVHVTAGARGAAVEITIRADRPETQALLTQALPEIQQTLAERGLGSASISVVTTPTADDGRRSPDRRPAEPRERPTTPHPNDRRRMPSASRRVSAVDITV